MQGCIAGARPTLGPWCLEILFLLAYHRELRFGELSENLEGISSRTLTDKLAQLAEHGFVDKQVDLDGSHVRIRYSLTKRGLQAAVLAGPFMSAMNAAGGFEEPVETEPAEPSDSAKPPGT